jgi:hypothetical protein
LPYESTIPSAIVRPPFQREEADSRKASEGIPGLTIFLAHFFVFQTNQPNVKMRVNQCKKRHAERVYEILS